MKNLIAFVFCLLPLVAFSQDMDSVRVAGEVDSLLQLSRTITAKGNFDEAIQQVEAAKGVTKNFFGVNPEWYAKCIFFQGRIFQSFGKYPDAETNYLQAKAIQEKSIGVLHLDYAFTLNNLALVYQNQGFYEKAIETHLKAKNIREKVCGKEHKDYVQTLNNLAIAYHLKGEYAIAKELCLEALPIQAKLIGNTHPNYAVILVNLANNYKVIGEYDKALAANLEAKSIREKALGKEHPDYAQSLLNTSNIYWETGKFDKALSLLYEALNIREKTIGKEHPDYATNLNNIAGVYWEKGEYEKSLALFLEAKSILENTLGKEHPSYAQVLNNLGECYKVYGDYERAIKLYTEALEIQKTILGKWHTDYAQVLNNLANIYLEKGEYETALSHYEESKGIREKSLGKEHVDYALSLNNIGRVYFEKPDYEKAIFYYAEAKKILSDKKDEGLVGLALVLDNLALVYKDKGDIKEAIPLHSQVKSIRSQLLGTEHADYVLTLYRLALAFEEDNQLEKASTNLMACNNATKFQIQKSANYSSEREIIQYQSTFEKRFAHLLHFTQSHPTDSLFYGTYDNALFLNNAQLFNAVAREKGIVQTDSSTRAIHTEWKSCRFQLGKLYSQLIAERDAGLVARLEEQANDYEKELVRRSPEFAEGQKEVYWQDVKSQLNPNEAAIEFVNYSWQNRKTKADTTMYTALVLFPNATAPAFVPLCQESELLAALDAPNADRAAYLDRLYRGIKPKANSKIEGLYQLLWQPLDSLLQGTKRIYYAPSGLLHRINLAAIPNPAEQITIGAKYELVQLGSTRQLVVKDETVFTLKDAVVLGGINYEAENAAPLPDDSSATEDALAFGSSPDFSGLTRNLRGGEWNYLEGTAKEATNIAKLLKKKGFQAKTLSGHAATEEAFKAIGQGRQSPRVLHIATHGFFFPDQASVGSSEPVFKQSDNPMIRSGLILAGANPVWKGEPTPVGKEDGILTAYEISQMNLQNTELVVLSACETGLGDIQGSEGVYGLQRAFKIAGVKHLIMSLWDVPDSETAEFMANFYKEWLGGKDINAAFRHTQQAMQEAYPNEPFLWAGFVLVE